MTGTVRLWPLLRAAPFSRIKARVSAFHYNTRQNVRTTRSCAIGGVQGQVEEEEGAG